MGPGGRCFWTRYLSLVAHDEFLILAAAHLLGFLPEKREITDDRRCEERYNESV